MLFIRKTKLVNKVKYKKFSNNPIVKNVKQFYFSYSENGKSFKRQ